MAVKMAVRRVRLTGGAAPTGRSCERFAADSLPRLTQLRWGRTVSVGTLSQLVGEPREDDVGSLSAVGRASRPRQVVILSREAHQLGVAPEET